MHLRVVHATAGGALKRYAQLVQSYRRGDGVPAQRVVASLGALSDQEIENLRRALAASRRGEAVVLPSETQPADWQVKVIANLQYLDVAVALTIWNSWKLNELFNRLLPRGADTVPSSLVIAPLVLQRCISPGSKLYAQRWFPRTALPEMLGVKVEHFNNSRIHRVLEDLDRVDADLQRELVKRYEHKDGAFAALFLDVTDTYFQGRGCELAQRDRTKEGLRNVHKIGIVLLCNEHGFPVRWQVVAGKRRDPQCMSDMIDTVEGLSWVRGVPFVGDRGMGSASAVGRLVASGLRFLTAARATEIASYTDELPSHAFADLNPTGSELSLDEDMERARTVAASAGLEKVDDMLFIKDLGVCKRELKLDHAPVDSTGAAHNPADHEGGAAFLAFARVLQRKLELKQVKNRAGLAREFSLTRARVTQVLTLLELDAEIQERVLRGDFGYVPERLLRRAARKPAREQREMIESHAEKGVRGGSSRPFRRTGKRVVELRLVAYFNPQMFVEQRDRANRRRLAVEAWARELNARLVDVERVREDVYRQVCNELEAQKMLAIYEVAIEQVTSLKGKTCCQVRITPDGDAWRKRRRFDGFVLLVAHPELPQVGADLARLYRAKDAVEKDFRTIKEVIKLRPVFHHTDPKVRAHVTLCMLGLLLERTLEQRLKRTAVRMTAPACFELLRACHLNMIQSAPEVGPSYQLTEPTAEMKGVVTSLRMLDLLDPEQIQTRVTPRAP
jgi:hypothetical protein